jgi:phosphoglycolate phosphatase-like HAD superfamily hydrolase
LPPDVAPPAGRAWPARPPATVIFDFDGVVLDSNRLKTDAFGTVLAAAGYSTGTVKRFLSYQARNFGRSRYLLFDDFLRDFADGEAGERDAGRLLAAFGRACVEGYGAVPETLGIRRLLDRLRGAGSRLFVASGSDQEELRGVVAARGLGGYFEDVLGSPTRKTDCVAAILRALGGAEAAASAWFVGDAVADLKAAEDHGVAFVYVRHYSNVKDLFDGDLASRCACIVETPAELADRLPPVDAPALRGAGG